jgi:hypothetical protein
MAEGMLIGSWRGEWDLGMLHGLGMLISCFMANTVFGQIYNSSESALSKVTLLSTMHVPSSWILLLPVRRRTRMRRWRQR